VKNITVSVPDETYRAARVAAAERGTSVSAVVREFLDEFSGRPDRRELMKLLDEIRANNPGFSASENLSREELYNERFDRRFR